jgi:hypothetical protein
VIREVGESDALCDGAEGYREARGRERTAPSRRLQDDVGEADGQAEAGRIMIERDAAPLQESEGPLREGEIFPPKCRRAVTRSRADQCHWCDDPFVEPKRKRFVILDVTNYERGWPWGLVSICYECWKWEALAHNRWEIENHKQSSDDHGLQAERAERKCQGCGEPISLPIPGEGRRFIGTWRWFSWGVCSMRCYQRAYRKRRRDGGGSTIDWKWNGDGPRHPRCEACKVPLPRGKRSDVKFCSNRCRQWTYRRRRLSPRSEKGPDG